MEELSERRRLRTDLQRLGIAGLALLRLHSNRDLEGAEECVAEVRESLEAIDRDSASLEERSPLLDVVSGYRRWADVYDLPGNPIVECEEPAVRQFIDGFEGDPILDAACGTGRHLAHLSGRGHSVIGTDISPDMIEKARQKVPAADLRLGDIMDLPLTDSEVDAVVCALALEHVADLSGAYRELARVTKTGGSIVVSTMHPLLRLIFGWGAWFVDGEGRADIPTYPHSVGDHLGAASGAGLDLLRCEEPTVSPSSLPADVSPATRIAYMDVPLVLVLQFGRRES